MARSRAVLSLGANKGDREWNVLSAAARLAGGPRVEMVAMSSLYETEPVGEGYSQWFINAVCIVETEFRPRELLERCIALETEYGRRIDGARGPDRRIDIDIIAFDSITVDEPDLKIPHPRARERLFVLVPLMEAAPLTRLQPDGATPSEVIRYGESSGMVIRISSRCLLDSNYLNIKQLD